MYQSIPRSLYILLSLFLIYLSSHLIIRSLFVFYLHTLASLLFPHTMVSLYLLSSYFDLSLYIFSYPHALNSLYSVLIPWYLSIYSIPMPWSFSIYSPIFMPWTLYIPSPYLDLSIYILSSCLDLSLSIFLSACLYLPVTHALFLPPRTPSLPAPVSLTASPVSPSTAHFQRGVHQSHVKGLAFGPLLLLAVRRVPHWAALRPEGWPSLLHQVLRGGLR